MFTFGLKNPGFTGVINSARFADLGKQNTMNNKNFNYAH